jgi:hypothetical protein
LLERKSKRLGLCCRMWEDIPRPMPAEPPVTRNVYWMLGRI